MRVWSLSDEARAALLHLQKASHFGEIALSVV
jgi:hypothetical protein